MATIFKVIALAAGALSYRTCIKPPTPAPTSNDSVFTGAMFEKCVRSTAFLSRGLAVFLFMCEIAVTLATAYPRTPPANFFHNMCPSPPSDPRVLLSISPTFVAGAFLAASAAALRLACYRTLGKFFTFEVALQPSHALVTSGPYSYVRHPGYSGVILVFLGVIPMLFAEQGWIRQCGVMSSIFGLAVRLWLFIVAWTAYSLCQRTWIEDGNLRERFGKVWESYACDVPYKLIPGLY